MNAGLISPTVLGVIPENIPRELTRMDAWYPFRFDLNNERRKKVPYDPMSEQKARWRSAKTRCTFDAAYMAYQSGRFDGIGLVLDKEADLVGLDLDHCVSNDGTTIAPWALNIVNQFDGAYWEYSVSRTGLRGFGRGTLPDAGRRTTIEGCSVEIYCDQRYLVVTGHVFRPASKLPNLQPAIDSLYSTLKRRAPRARASITATGLKGRCRHVTPTTQRLIEAVLGGPRGDQMRVIWGRRDRQATGVSQDDWKLANEVTYQAIRLGYDSEALGRVVEEAMRAGPYRQKWDEGRNGATWLAMIIGHAIQKKQTEYLERQVAETMSDEHASDQNASDENVNSTGSDRAVSEGALQAEIARQNAIVAVQQNVIRAHRAEAEQLAAIHAENHARQAATEAVRRNSELSRAERELGIVLARLVESAQSRGYDHVRVHYPDLAKQAGISQRTVMRCMKTLADWDDAPFVKHTTTELRIVADPATGRQALRPTSVTQIGARVAGCLLAALAAYQPERPRHGGSRVRGETRSEQVGDWSQRPAQVVDLLHSARTLAPDPPPPVDGDTNGCQDGAVGEQNEPGVSLMSGRGRRRQQRRRFRHGCPNEEVGKVSAWATRRTRIRSWATTRARQASATAHGAIADQQLSQRRRSRTITSEGCAQPGSAAESDAPLLAPTRRAESSRGGPQPESGGGRLRRST